jgi:sterol desaturase/sphingolipid hydroxylase (fatty acid hydroxylase superfamily)
MWLEFQTQLLALPQRLIALSMALAGLALIFAIAERKFPLHPQKILRESWLIDVGYFFLAATVPGFVMLPVMYLTITLLSPLGPMPWHPWVADLPVPVAFVASTLLGEVGYYWAHRITHQVPFLWRFHAIHHSAPQLDWLVNARSHPLDASFVRAFIFMGMYFVGFGQRAPDSQNLVQNLYVLWVTGLAYFLHSNIRLRLGWLEYVVPSPAFHHWHHTKGDPALVNKNYASVLPCLDIVFGTFYLPKNEWPQQYGIDDALVSTLWGQLIDPLRHRRIRQLGLAAWGREALKRSAKNKLASANKQVLKNQ